jgi:hypothetical protein
MANLTTFKGKVGYGVRPNLFEVKLGSTNISGWASAIAGDIYNTDSKLQFLCRSAGVPASSIGTVEVPFRGRVIKLPGDRTFESWTITVISDENMVIRSFFEQWLNRLNEHKSGAGYTTDTNMFAGDLTVTQLKRGNTGGAAYTGNSPDPHSKVRTYRFKNAFPSNVSSIDLSYDNNNTVAEYTVEFQYDWWEVTLGSGGFNEVGSDTGSI